MTGNPSTITFTHCEPLLFTLSKYHHPDVHAVGNSEGDSIVDNPVVNKSEVRDQLNLPPPQWLRSHLSMEAVNQDGQSCSMRRVVDASPFASKAPLEDCF